MGRGNLRFRVRGLIMIMIISMIRIDIPLVSFGK